MPTIRTFRARRAAPATCCRRRVAVPGRGPGLLDNPRNTVDPQAKTLIYWINDGGTFNKGYIKLDGIDFQGSYDWDWGDVGAFNVGITGTYYLHQKQQTIDGALDRGHVPHHARRAG